MTPAHRDAESRFLRLVSDAGLDPPDTITYEPESLTFFWTEPKVAVIVDLDDTEASAVVDARASSAAAELEVAACDRHGPRGPSRSAARRPIDGR